MYLLKYQYSDHVKDSKLYYLTTNLTFFSEHFPLVLNIRSKISKSIPTNFGCDTQ